MSQVYKTPKARCRRCGSVGRNTEKVSERLGAGRLCPDCLIPAALEQQKEQE